MYVDVRVNLRNRKHLVGDQCEVPNPSQKIPSALVLPIQQHLPKLHFHPLPVMKELCPLCHGVCRLITTLSNLPPFSYISGYV